MKDADIKKALEIMKGKNKQSPKVNLPEERKDYSPEELKKFKRNLPEPYKKISPEEAKKYKRTLELQMTPNSRAQYLQNKEAGDPLAIENSYEQWKKL